MKNILEDTDHNKGRFVRVDFREKISRYHNIPVELKAQACWCWSSAEEKIPRNPATGRNASTIDSGTWGDFDSAVTSSPDRIGFVFCKNRGYTGIDLDHCRDPETGSIHPWARRIIQKLDSYTEVSQSGTGVHVIVRARMTGDKHQAHEGDARMEMYDDARYLILTGRVLAGRSSIRRCNLEALERRLGAHAQVRPSARQKKDESASAEDFKLMFNIAERTGAKDADALEAAFRRRYPQRAAARDEKKGHRSGKSYIRYTAERCLLRLKPQTDDASNWRDFFRTRSQLNATPLSFVIKGLVPEEGIIGIGGLSGHAKTFVMLSMAKAIWQGGFLWTQFKAEHRYPVLYLIPESGDRSFRHRLELLHIPDDEAFLVRTMSQGPPPSLGDEVLRKAAKGRVVFLDTLPRFTEGKDEQQARDMAELNEGLLGLLQAGAVAVVFAHHSPKSSRNENDMALENVFRGSGDIGAIMAAAHGVRMLNAKKTLVQIECVKSRDFEALEPFQLEGRPWIDEEGDFRMSKKPGQCSSLARETRKIADSDLGARVLKIIKQTAGLSGNRICEQVGGNRNRVFAALADGLKSGKWRKEKVGKSDSYYLID